jgi:membrane-associated PAP2 superfamily phosphatase
VLALWALLLAAALAAPWWPHLRAQRHLLWLTVLAMALGPAVVAGLKDINTVACPWDLSPFGGSASYRFEWFVSRAQAGRCFPGGHAAGGFSLVALVFAGRLSQWRELERWSLLATLVLGSLFGWVRLMQGAHFMSHNLWAAALDWWLALACFTPALLAQQRSAGGHSTPQPS